MLTGSPIRSGIWATNLVDTAPITPIASPPT